LIWYKETALSEKDAKYQIEQKKMSKCKLQSILSIFNVTEDDEGDYSCNWDCINRVAVIHLEVFVQSQTGKSLLKKEIIQQNQCSFSFKTMLNPNPKL